MRYQPKFTKTKRDGKVALWVEMPNGDSYNIEDLPKKLADNPDVLSAVMSAFYRGGRAYKMLSDKLYIAGEFGTEFEEVKDEKKKKSLV